MIEVLIPIWERAFQRSSIGIEDTFFDLGGNPCLARQIFAEIEKSTGKFFCPEMIYQAPTIAAQKVLLEQATAPRLNPLALLKAGSGPPIFFAHGMGGNVFEFFELSKFINWPGPIYGLQARGNNGVEEPFAEIEGLADYFLDAIKQVQPQGPYFLIGYSLGGLVTLEMARFLSSRSEKAALLVMIDSYPHRSHLEMLQYLLVTSRRIKRRAWERMVLPYRRRSYTTTEGHPSTQMEAVSRRTNLAGNLAWKRYRPSFYSGKVGFVKAAIPTVFPDSPGAVWGELVKEIEVQIAPGDHHEILRKHFEILAAVLSKYLKQATME